MFSKKNIPILIVSAVLVALLAAIIALSFVSSVWLKDRNDFEYANVYEASSTTAYKQVGRNTEGNQKKQYDQLVDSFAKTRFSIMQGILEGRWTTSPRYLTQTNDDGVVEKYQAKKSEVTNYQAAQGQYLLELNYGLGSQRTLQIPNIREDRAEHGANDTITYDTLLFAIGDSNGEVAEVKVYAYEYDYFMGSPIDLEDRYVTPFYIYIQTTPLYKAVKDIAKGEVL
ncbi:MAG: hypothetical protein FWD76_00370 [Firmicutes bacterium]|nr:hypothetical protein [Bacillota bacterium]